MSFAADVKKELTQLLVHEANGKAELAALLRMSGSARLGFDEQLVIKTENAAIARRIYSLVRDFYQATVETEMQDPTSISKHHSYHVVIQDQVQPIIEELGIDIFGVEATVPQRMVNEEAKQRSFLRGAFLAGGSVNSPEAKDYHLEIYTLHEGLADQIIELIEEQQLGLAPKKIVRRSGYIVYFKSSEMISTFLQMIGATQSMLQFEDARIMRDTRNSANRLVNAEIANEVKAQSTAKRQLDRLRLIDRKAGLAKLPPRLREIANLRFEYDEESLVELGQHVAGKPLGKSGVNHRMRELMKIADQLEQGEVPDFLSQE